MVKTRVSGLPYFYHDLIKNVNQEGTPARNRWGPRPILEMSWVPVVRSYGTPPLHQLDRVPVFESSWVPVFESVWATIFTLPRLYNTGLSPVAARFSPLFRAGDVARQRSLLSILGALCTPPVGPTTM